MAETRRFYLYSVPHSNACRNGADCGEVTEAEGTIGRLYITIGRLRFNIQPIRDVNQSICHQQDTNQDYLLFEDRNAALAHRERDLLLAQLFHRNITNKLHDMNVQQLRTVQGVLDQMEVGV